jgi:hypothetical protein
MSYKVTIAQKPGFLHVTVTGQNTKETVAGYLQEVLRGCMANDCYRVLIEERLEGPRLGTLDVFNIAAQGSEPAVGTLKAIAYVDVKAEGELMKFAENVAVNRCLRVAVFPTVAAAEAWLVQLVAADTRLGSPLEGRGTDVSGHS